MVLRKLFIRSATANRIVNTTYKILGLCRDKRLRQCQCPQTSFLRFAALPDEERVQLAAGVGQSDAMRQGIAYENSREKSCAHHFPVDDAAA